MLAKSRYSIGRCYFRMSCLVEGRRSGYLYVGVCFVSSGGGKSLRRQAGKPSRLCEPVLILSGSGDVSP